MALLLDSCRHCSEAGDIRKDGVAAFMSQASCALLGLWLRARRRLKGLNLGRQWLKFPWRATFHLSSEADWQALVREALKGAPLSSLGATSYDGIAIEPLYARAKDERHSRPRARRGLGGDAARRSARCRSRQQTQILDDLNNAARGIVLVFEEPSAITAMPFRPTEAAIEAGAQGVHLD